MLKIHVLELEKLPKEDSYIDEAYEMLKHMSADEKKRLEYEAREKAIRDYNSQIQSAEERGQKRGEQEKAVSIIINMLQKGKTPEEIADMMGESLVEVLKVQGKERE